MAIFNFRAIGPVFIASVGNYSVNIYNDAYTPIDTADMNQINVLGISRGIYYNLLECDDPTGFADFSDGFSGIHKEIVSGIKLKLGGSDVSSSNPLPVANAGYHYSVTGKTNADGVVTLTATQIPTLAAVWQNRITISKGTATSGTLGIKIKLVGATAYSTLLENGSAVVVNFASITEPATYVFDGDIEGWQITPTSVVGAYNISVAGH